MALNAGSPGVLLTWVVMGLLAWWLLVRTIGLPDDLPWWLLFLVTLSCGFVGVASVVQLLLQLGWWPAFTRWFI